MKKTLLTILSVMICAAGAACKGGSTDFTPSGALSAKEQSLYNLLPAGSQMVFGGNYKDFMAYWENSPLKDLLTQLQKDQEGAGMDAWMDCWADVGDLEYAGAMSFGDDGLKMQMLFRGMGRDFVTKCATKLEGVKLTTEADGKFLVLDGIPNGMGGTQKTGYYFIDDQTALSVYQLPLGAGGDPTPRFIDAAEIEADLARAKKAPLGESAAFKALTPGADRSKAMWFCGTAEGTPVARQLKGGCGSVAVSSDALTMVFSIEVASEKLASQAVASIEQARSQVAMIPAQMEAVREAATDFLDDLKVTANGNKVEGHFKLSNDVLKPLVGLMASAMPRR